MLLKDYLKENKVKGSIAILTINKNGEIESQEFDFLKKIPKKYLQSEFIESKQEDDCLEIWLM